jgi:thioredoxin reductase (NADPH)
MNDVIIIGARPVGLYGAYLAGLRGLKGLVLESLPLVGGQLTTLYPEKKSIGINHT